MQELEARLFARDEHGLDARPEELDSAHRVGDGLIVTRSDAARYLRGGSYAFGANASRFGFLSTNSPAFRDSKIGFRAARALRPLEAPAYR